MRKLTKQQIQDRKPVIGKIESTVPASEKKKYERPDFAQQLKNLKDKSAAENPGTKTTKVQIVVSEFKYTKTKPLRVENWLLWRSINNQLIIMPEPLKPGQRFYTFDLSDGTAYLIDKPNSRYAYFHDAEFQKFLERYNITKVSRRASDGEYQGRNEEYSNNVSVFSFVTDGEYTSSDESALRMDENPIIQMKQANTFISVTNSTFVIFEQIVFRTDTDDIMPFVLRQLISDYDIYDIEGEIASACAQLDNQSDQEVDKQAIQA